MLKNVMMLLCYLLNGGYYFVMCSTPALTAGDETCEASVCWRLATHCK